MPWGLFCKTFSASRKCVVWPSRGWVSSLEVKVHGFCQVWYWSSLMGWSKTWIGGLIKFFLDILFEHILNPSGSVSTFICWLNSFLVHIEFLAWFLQGLGVAKALLEVAWISSWVGLEISSLLRWLRRESWMLCLILLLWFVLIDGSRLGVLNSLSDIGSKVLPNVKIAFALNKWGLARNLISLCLKMLLAPERLWDRTQVDKRRLTVLSGRPGFVQAAAWLHVYKVGNFVLLLGTPFWLSHNDTIIN